MEIEMGDPMDRSLSGIWAAMTCRRYISNLGKFGSRNFDMSILKDNS
jgi:hypothetical protein